MLIAASIGPESWPSTAFQETLLSEHISNTIGALKQNGVTFLPYPMLFYFVKQIFFVAGSFLLSSQVDLS
jgi:hypothetical protein